MRLFSGSLTTRQYTMSPPGHHMAVRATSKVKYKWNNDYDMLQSFLKENFHSMFNTFSRKSVSVAFVEYISHVCIYSNLLLCWTPRLGSLVRWRINIHTVCMCVAYILQQAIALANSENPNLFIFTLTLQNSYNNQNDFTSFVHNDIICRYGHILVKHRPLRELGYK